MSKSQHNTHQHERYIEDPAKIHAIVTSKLDFGISLKHVKTITMVNPLYHRHDQLLGVGFLQAIAYSQLFFSL